MAISMGIGPLLVYGLTAMSPLVISELSLSRTQFGSFATTAFLAAALSSGLVGGLVDRISERVTMYLLYGGSAVALWIAATAQNYAWMLVAVVVSGTVQALSNPVTNRLVAEYTGPAERGTLMGVKQSGVQMAQALAGLALPLLAVVAGWRGSLSAASVLALAGLALSARYIPRRRATDAPRTERGGGRATMPAVVWWLAAYALLSGCALQATNFYLPLYGYEALGLSMATAGLLAAVVGGVGLLARIGWGRAVGRLRSPRAALAVLAGGAGLGVVAITLADAVGSGLVWAGAALFGATGLAANVVLMVTVLRTVPPALVGRASGAMAIGLYLGFAVGPVSFGGIVDATGDYRIGWLAAVALYVLTGLLALLRRDWSPPVDAPS
ncbi:MFS transporter [Georgenia sp. AZ-5]|uniref:MFS transporter n=1 Tax=Georgenia sp. AZ-5 TaxID=3367526 RepID=UPI003754B58B